VDTPGTNAISRTNTTRILCPQRPGHLCHLGRPALYESERAFMEQDPAVGQKVIIILNKIDSLTSRKSPMSWSISQMRWPARLCARDSARVCSPGAAGKLARPRRARSAVGRQPVPGHGDLYLKTLDEKSRVQLKLQNPLGWRAATGWYWIWPGPARPAGQGCTPSTTSRAARHLPQDMQRDFHYRGRRRNALLAMNSRACLFDETLRVARVWTVTPRIGPSLSGGVADTPQEIERDVQGLIDWLVERTCASGRHSGIPGPHRARLKAEADAHDLRGRQDHRPSRRPL